MQDVLIALACCASISTMVTAQEESPATQPCDCVQDLEAASTLLEHDYAGYQTAYDLRGAQIDRAWSEAREKAQGATADRTPIARPHSDGVFLMRFPSFATHFKSAVDGLLAQHEQEIRSTETLVIDLRGNTGGGDSTWTGIIKPLYTDPMKRWNAQWRPTEGNAAGIEEQIAQLAGASETPPPICSLLFHGQNRRHQIDAVPQISDTQVFIGPMLIVVVVGDRQDNGR